MVALNPETELIGGVLYIDDLAVRSGVRVRTLLHQSVLVFTNRLQVTCFFSLNVVTSFVPINNNWILEVIYKSIKYLVVVLIALLFIIYSMFIYSY